ncbi:MAG: DoxX family protein [Chloroflexi bacterium]|nr:DoxX family protein [Chloroflexota bacterium]
MLTGLALLAIRIGVGIELVVHGWPKLKNPAGTAGFFGQIGMKPALFWAWIAALVEFLGGIALIIGLLTRPAAFFITLEFLIISFYLKPRKMKVPFTTPQGAGWEWDWLIMMMGLALLLAGSGIYGLDSLIGLPF